MRKCFMLGLFLCMGLFTSQIQPNQNINNSDLTGLVEKYKDLFKETKYLIEDLDQKETTATWDLWNYTPIDTKNESHFKITEKKNWLKDLNLNWVSDVAYNFTPGISDQEDIFYKTRISTGLDYSALGQGSLKNRNAQKAILNQELKRDSIQNLIRKTKLNRGSQLFLIQQVFDQQKLKVLKSYKPLLAKLYNFELAKHHKGLINEAELFKAKKELEDNAIQIKTLEENQNPKVSNLEVNQYGYLATSKVPNLPLLDSLHLNNLLKDEEGIIKLQKAIIDSKTAMNQTLDLKLKLRYNHYTSKDQLARNFASIGASFNLPLTKNENLIDEHQLNSSEEQLKDARKSLRNDLFEMYRHYNNMKEEVFILENKNNYLRELMAVAIKAEKNQSSPAKFMEYAQEFIQNKLLISDKKNVLCQKYFTFMMVSGLKSAKEEPEQPNTEKNRAQDTRDHLGSETYVWASFFNEKSNDYLLELLDKWHINTLFLSGSKTIDVPKLKNFQSLAASKQIKLYRLIGENSFAKKEDGFQDLRKVLVTAKNEGYEGIHLDIEPHTFDDYKSNIELYAKRQIYLFQNAAEWCKANNMDLSASVPMQLPAQVAVALYQNNITTYIMAYDSLSLEKKILKTQEIRDILQDKYRWVFRINDFPNYDTLLDAENTLIQNNISAFSYYDLSQMNLFKD